MSLQRIEAIARENYETGQHGARHLMLGFDVMEVLKARAVKGAPPNVVPTVVARDSYAELTSIPIIVADESTLHANAWQLRENAGHVVVEDGVLGDDPECQHERSRDIRVQPDRSLRVWCMPCGAEWTVRR